MKKHMATRVLAMLTSLCLAGAEVMSVFAEGTDVPEGEHGTEIVAEAAETETSKEDAPAVSESENRISEEENVIDVKEDDPEESMTEEAESALDDFTYGVSNGVYYIESYIGTSPIVEIPEKDKDGNTITCIGKRCFAGNVNITSVTIPQSISIISYGAFSGCTGLKSMTIYSKELGNIERLENENAVFWNAGAPDGMTVTFGEGVIRIPGFMFYTNVYDRNKNKGYCKISKVIISDTVTEIGNTAFTNCWDLKEVEGGANVKTLDNWAFSNTGLLKYPVSMKSVETMNEGAFAGSDSLTEAVLPEGLTAIGPKAFYSCYALSTATIPSTLLQLEYRAFGDCTGLKTLNVNSKELRNIDRLENENAVFWNAGSPDGMTVTFGNGVERIPSFMFYTNVYDRNKNKGYCKISKVIISDTVTEIGNTAFTNCWDLKEVEGGANVKTLDNWAFSNTGLLKYPVSMKSVELMNEGAFEGAGALTEAILPEGLTYIGPKAFEGCSALSTVSLPATLMTIDYAAFKNCTGLKNLTVNSKELKDANLTNGNAVFYNAGVLVGDGMTVTFTSGVTHIPACMFGVNVDKNSSKEWCRLYEVFIAGSVKDVGDWAFQGCYGLKKIHFQGKAPKIAENSFYNVEATAYYPDGEKSWTKDKCQDYGGKLTWMSESGKAGNVSKLTEELLNSAVTFISNGADETAPFFKINKSGKKATLVKLHKKGYTFKGWYFNGKKVKSITPKYLKKNPTVTLEAKFTPNKYTISYKVPKKVDGVKVKGKIKLTKEEKKISYEGGMLTAKGSELECEGHTLKGWSLEKGGTVVVVKPGETVSLEKLIPEKGKTIKLYPVW